MPYIKQERRGADVAWEGPQNAGELNFNITLEIVDYLVRKGLNYQHINDVVGALEGAKVEFQRRIVGPYEDQKIADNGDVYPPELLGKAHGLSNEQPAEVIGYDNNGFPIRRSV